MKQRPGVLEVLKRLPYRSQLLRRLLGLYGIQVANIAFPLLTLPYLSRVLGPEAFGLYATGQALAMFLQTLVEYGFSLSGAREVSKHRLNKEKLSQVLARILMARFLLAIPATFLSVLAFHTLPILKGQAALTLSALIWALASGLNPTWFFLGLEQVRLVVLSEVVPRALSTLGIFLLVKDPGHAHLPLLLNGLATLAISTALIPWLRRHLNLRLAPVAEGMALLRQGRHLFLFRVAAGLQATAGVFVLGVFAPSTQVGLYAAVDKLVKPLAAMWEPFNRLFSARFAYLAASDPSKGNALGQQVFMVMVGLGFLGAALINFTAPTLISLLLGKGYMEGIGILRVLSLILPLSAASHFLGAQWMLPHGMDRALARIAISAVLVSLTLGPVSAHYLGALGMAWTEVAVAALIGIARFVYLLQRKGLPWQK